MCVKALKTGKRATEGSMDEAFVLCGYCNWKDAFGDKGGFASRESSSVHKRAVEVIEMTLVSNFLVLVLRKSYEIVHIFSNQTIFDETRPSIVG